VDETFWRLTESQDGLNGLIPTTSYLTRELFLLKQQHSKPTIANVYGEEQEIFNSRTRLTLNTELISNCKIGKQYTWKGMDFVEMDRLQNVTFNSYDGADAVRLAIENYFFGRAADLIPAIGDVHRSADQCSILSHLRQHFTRANVASVSGNRSMDSADDCHRFD